MISSLKEEYETIEALGATVIALSADSVESHILFCESLGGCPFPLASDTDLAVPKAYDAIAEDGRSPIRSLYVVDQTLTVILRIPWYQPGNVGQFMEIFRALGME